ncbi:DUF5316 domain-containing protein [Bacillus licheniformis]
MKRAFLAGAFVCLIAVLVSAAAGDWTLIFKVSGAAGLGAILLSALCSGVFVSGDRFRGNHDAETKARGVEQQAGKRARHFRHAKPPGRRNIVLFRLLTSDSE